MVGIESRNEKRTAAARERPTSRPPMIEAPERETPGMSAVDWATPMSSAPRAWWQ
jgi:hypothetical protein